ncbi:hypothetical protein N9N67_05150 [Bacteriovoracaceae bacterium]|nr:hypothetical protein [Bacteriovoracaceae bacterium]
MIKILLGTLMLVSFSAFSYGEKLSFKKFKDSCVNYTNYGYQQPPSEIVISCSNAVYDWEQLEDSEMQAETSRFLKAGLISNKNKVVAKEFDIEIDPYNFMCPRFKEILKTFAQDFNANCTELVNYEGSLKEWCLEKINTTIGENPEAQQTQDTGRVIVSCKNKPLNRRSTTHQR